MGVTLGVVVLTMGNRPAELVALLESVRAQEGSESGVRTVVLGQGAELPELPEWVDAVELPENLGIPGGRNVGVERLRELGGMDVLVVLDDDGLLPRTDTFRLVREAFERDPRWASSRSGSRTRPGSPSAATSPAWARPTRCSPGR